MYFAHHVVNHPDELQADFQQTYNIMDVIGRVEDGEITPIYAANLAAQLPYGARIHVADNSDCAWSKQEMLLSHVIYVLECSLYAQGGCKGKRPQPIFKPSNSPKNRINTSAMSLESLVALIGDGMEGNMHQSEK